MEKIDVVYEKRYEFAFKLKQVMEEKSYTKARLCKEAGISRPTLDKLLACNVTNMTTFKKHLAKIAECLEINPEELVHGVVAAEFTKDRYLKHMKSSRISEIEDFVNRTAGIEVINISSFNVLNGICHVLWYWFYPER